VDLGAAFGLPAAFWVEALNLGDDRGLVGLIPANDGGAPRELRTPPRQLRLGLRFQL
jgi:hypothetical protein